MESLDSEWLSFLHSSSQSEGTYTPYEMDTSKIMPSEEETLKEPTKKSDIPTPTDIYISTKTKIAYLNTTINLNDLFWKLDVIPYSSQEIGIIKKEIKITSEDEEIKNAVEEKFKEVREEYGKTIYSNYALLKCIDNREYSGGRYKHECKVTFGLSNKDIMAYNIKEKGAFYNSFTLVIRVNDTEEDTYKEVNVKVFNTGRLQIPGVKDDKTMMIALDMLTTIFSGITGKEITYDKEKVCTELINSNFKCGFYINRVILLDILNNKYGIISSFNACTYPGIQSNFYYNSNKRIQDGICSCAKQCSKKSHDNDEKCCIEIAFKIFRTGSVMILGKCKNDEMLREIYDYVKNILVVHYDEINEGNVGIIEKQEKKHKKRYVLVDVEDDDDNDGE